MPVFFVFLNARGVFCAPRSRTSKTPTPRSQSPMREYRLQVCVGFSNWLRFNRQQSPSHGRKPAGPILPPVPALSAVLSHFHFSVLLPPSLSRSSLPKRKRFEALAGSMPGATPVAGDGEEEDKASAAAAGETLPLKYTVVSTAVFLLLS